MQICVKHECQYCSRKNNCELKTNYEAFQIAIQNASIPNDEHFKVNIYCDQRYLDKVTFIQPKTEDHHCSDDACYL